MANTGFDIQRLVYSPKVWAFTKDANEEVHDLTEFIISGEVHRKTGQASNFSLKLRNPEMRFTTRGKKKAVFHPMDPITIFMERITGRHVQVFTGYLDTTPYIQLIPGVIELQGTCTLKKLMFTWFQLAQEYTLALFKHYGWNVEENGVIGPIQGAIVPSAAELKEQEKWEKELKEKKITEEQFNEKMQGKAKKYNEAVERASEELQGTGFKKEKKGAVPFLEESVGGTGKKATVGNDGSFKKMLWAVLYWMAEWRDENIYIEEMPPTVPALVAALSTKFEKSEQGAKEQLEAYFTAILGTGKQGNGGMHTGSPKGNNATGEVQGRDKIVATMTRIANEYHLPPAFVVATCIKECTLNVNNVGAEGAIGWFQWTSGTPYGFAGISGNFPQDAKDLGIATTDFCKAALIKGHELTGGHGLPGESEWNKWEAETQGSVLGSGWSGIVEEAKQLVSRYGNAASTTESGGNSSRGARGVSGGDLQGISGSTEAGELSGVTGSAEAGERSKSKGGGKSSAPGQESFEGYHWPFEKAHVTEYLRLDQGADYKTAGNGEQIVAIADQTLVATAPGWNGGNLYAFQVTQGGPLHGRFLYYAECLELLPGKNSPKAGEAFAVTNYSHFTEAPCLEFGYCDVNGVPISHSEYNIAVGNVTKGAEYYAQLMRALGQKNPPSTGWPSSSTPAVPGGKAPEILQHGTSTTGEGGNNMLSTATAASFISQIAAPSQAERAKAKILGGQRSLMNATPTLNLVQQICKASLREFMSLPNGDFYAFYPDYFGEFNHRNPYWEIHNIEIIDGKVDLTDENLATHVFTVGSPAWPATGSLAAEVINERYSGVMTIFEAFTPGILLNKEPQGPAKSDTKSADEAVAFLKRYGARPMKLPYPMVYSTIFESLLAFQQFLLAWARQFRSVFKFTFMPELFPGGRVAFPEHSLQMYVEEVVHTWDNQSGGYQTVATLLAPSVYTGNKKAEEELPERMVRALVEPQRGELDTVKPPPTSPQPKRAKASPKVSNPVKGVSGSSAPTETDEKEPGGKLPTWHGER